MDVAITIFAHVPDERAEAPTILPEDVTNGVVEYLGGQGVVVDSIDVNYPDDNDLVIYCFCGHEQTSHDLTGGKWVCLGCADDPTHDVDPAHAFQAAS